MNSSDLKLETKNVFVERPIYWQNELADMLMLGIIIMIIVAGIVEYHRYMNKKNERSE